MSQTQPKTCGYKYYVPVVENGITCGYRLRQCGQPAIGIIVRRRTHWKKAARFDDQPLCEEHGPYILDITRNACDGVFDLERFDE